jgi:hypothetical protein
MAIMKIDIYQKEDGFWVGRELKNGQMAAGSYHITGEDIMTMFTTLFMDFCNEQKQDKLLMQDASGQLFVTAKVPANRQKKQKTTKKQHKNK